LPDTLRVVPVRYRVKYNEDQERDDHGRWTSGGGGEVSPSDTRIAPFVDDIGRGTSDLPATATGAAARAITAADLTAGGKPESEGGNSRAVSPEEFQLIAAEGQADLARRDAAGGPPTGLDQNFEDIKATAFAAVQESWGGATYDAHTGAAVTTGYALTARDPGQASVTLSEAEAADRDTFNAAMDRARETFSDQLTREGAALGVFHNDADGRVEIDPTLVVATRAESDAIGAATYATGGSYSFSDGNGYWPPHVETGGGGGKSFAGRRVKYSPDQPRDDHGRFGEGGGGDDPTAGDPKGELPNTGTVQAAWSALDADRFDTQAQERAHPENYEPNRGFGTHLKEGATEWRHGVAADGSPTVYQVQAVPWTSLGSTADERLANAGLTPAAVPMRAADGMLLGLQKVPDSEQPEPYVYRVMSDAEFQQASDRGYIQTDARMNLGATEGTVTSRGSTGSFYMPPAGTDARIVQINMNPADGWRVDSDGYVKTQEHVPFERVQAYSERIPNTGKAFASLRVKYSPDQDRDDHGRFASGGGGSADAVISHEAAMLNDGKALPANDPLAEAIDHRTGGDAYTDRDHARIVEAVQAAPANAPELYRGFAMTPFMSWSPESVAAFTANLQPGATMNMKLGSWTQDPQVADDFAGTEGGGATPAGDGFETPTADIIDADTPRVVMTMEPGAQALNIAPNATEQYADQQEWNTLGTVRVESVEHEGPIWRVGVSQVNTTEPSDRELEHQAPTLNREAVTDAAVRAAIEGGAGVGPL
jgi:hypothetical protein